MKILVSRIWASGPALEAGMTRRRYTVAMLGAAATHRCAVRHQYDAIVLDLGLPDGDGSSCFSEWRQSGFNEPVIILSARDTVQDRTRASMGAMRYCPTFQSERAAGTTALAAAGNRASEDRWLEHRGIRATWSPTAAIQRCARGFDQREFGTPRDLHAERRPHTHRMLICEKSGRPRMRMDPICWILT